MRQVTKNYGLDNQQPSPDEGKVQRLLPAMVLGTSVPKWKPSTGADLCTYDE